jgi:hypothetical protein
MARDAELRVLVRAAEVRRTDQVQVVVEYAERGVGVEGDARHVRAYRGVAERCTETQPAILSAEAEEVTLQGGALEAGELSDENSHAAHSQIPYQSGEHRVSN